MWTVEYATKTVVWTRIDRCVFSLTKTHTFENALVWTGLYLYWSVKHGTLAKISCSMEFTVMTIEMLINSLPTSYQIFLLIHEHFVIFLNSQWGASQSAAPTERLCYSMSSLR